MTDEHACNLTDHLREQARDQAGDSGNAQQRIEWRAADEIERLRAIVDRLPVTADGVRVAPGDTVYHPNCVDGRGLRVFVGECGSAAPEDDGWFVSVPTRIGIDGFVSVSLEANLWECYSTREASEAAARETP